MNLPASTLDTNLARKVFATTLDAACPIPDIESPDNADRLACEVTYAGTALGTVELPMFDGFVSSYVLEDAIAAAFAWELLGRYLRVNLYPIFAVAREDNTFAW